MIVDEEMHDVILLGWQKGAKTVSATQAIMAHNKNIGLAQAKMAVDRCLEGKVTSFNFPTREAAISFSSSMRGLEFVTQVVKSDTGVAISDSENG